MQAITGRERAATARQRPGPVGQRVDRLRVGASWTARGSRPYILICTPASISRMTNKRGVFLIDKYTGIADLIDALNRFVTEIQEKTLGDPVHVMATNWKWEYGPVSKKHL